MKAFVVAIPLFDASMSVCAYQISDRGGDSLPGIKDSFWGITDAFLSPGLDLIEKIGPEPFAGDKPLFIPLNKFQLLTGVPTNMDIAPAKLVCVIPGSLAVAEDVMERVTALKEKGYTLALDDFPPDGIQSPFFAHVDYLVLDYSNSRFFITFKAVNTQRPGVTIVVKNIPDTDTYQKLNGTPNTLFTGAFYSQPVTEGLSEISPLKVNALQLLNQVNQSDFELSDIARIIERDPSLSISLLRFINSGAVNLKRKVGSINEAVAILGQNEVRRWATVAISVSMAEDRPGEITRLSLLRARFAENLATAFELGVFQRSLFMAGLFSLLDVILQKPMPEAINEVPVDERVRQALVDKSGDLYPVLELIYAYERGDWDNVTILSIRADVEAEKVTGSFVQALVWYHQLLQSLNGPEEPEIAAAPGGPEAENTSVP